MLITFLASFLIWVMYLGLLVLWVIDGRIKKEQVLHALAASLIVWVLSEMIKGLFPMERPFVINGFPSLTLTTPNDGAFPSVHTAVAFSLATTVWLHNKKTGFFFGIAAISVGIGRILANVHFPLDIVGGAFLGIVVAYLVQNLHLSKLVRK